MSTESTASGETIVGRRRSLLVPVLAAVYVGFCVSTFAGASFLIELLSPLTALLAVALICVSMRRLGRYRVCALLIGLGILAWATGDIIRFVNHFVLGTEPLSELVRTLYLLPNYLFGASTVTFLWLKLQKQDLYMIAANTFLISVIGFIALEKLLLFLAPPAVDPSAQLRAYLYFFVNSLIVVLGLHLIYLVGREFFGRGTNLIPVAILVYIVIDFQYTYMEALGQEPENVYMDLVYMLCMVLMAFGTYSQSVHNYVYQLRERDGAKPRIRYTRLTVPLLIILGVALRLGGVLTQNELIYTILALLGYVILCSTLRNNVLNEQLLAQQQELNTSLEAQVAEQTQDLKRANQDLKLLSSTDLLTGLYNRRHGEQALSELVRNAERYGGSFCVFGIDLNHFKPVNDTYGHEMGDRVLQEFGKRLKALPSRYTCVRSGGDEFVVYYANAKSREEIEAAAETLQSVFSEPIILESYIFHLSGSIGISIYPDDATAPEDLLQYADAAMYAVKRSKKRDDHRFFDSGLVASVERRRRIEEKLKSAEPARDFTLNYQPQIDITDGSVVGVEVFPRLKIPGLEDCTPAELLPVAEETGLMSRLGIWIAETALGQAADWNRRYHKSLTTTINLAPLQLLDADFIESLERILRRQELAPEQLILDVSNEVILGAAESAKDTLRAFHQFGYRLSLNDFGGGDINLSYIRDCGFSTIKLSRTLIPLGIEDPERLQIIRALLALAAELGIEVNAVGIEEKEQAELMRELGMRIMQGYFYSRPLSAGAFEKAMLSHS